MFKEKISKFVSSARRVQMAQAVASKKQRGYSMIEIAIGTVIVGLLLAVTISYVRGIIADNRANDELKEIPLVMSKLTKMYSNRPNFNGVSTAIAAQNNVYPPERINTGGATLNNRFGGAITIAAGTTLQADDSVVLSYTGVGASECKTMIPQLEKSMTRIMVGASEIMPVGGTVNFGTLGTACVDNVTIQYQFKKS